MAGQGGKIAQDRGLADHVNLFGQGVRQRGPQRRRRIARGHASESRGGIGLTIQNARHALPQTGIGLIAGKGAQQGSRLCPETKVQIKVDGAFDRLGVGPVKLAGQSGKGRAHLAGNRRILRPTDDIQTVTSDTFRPFCGQRAVRIALLPHDKVGNGPQIQAHRGGGVIGGLGWFGGFGHVDDALRRAPAHLLNQGQPQGFEVWVNRGAIRRAAHGFGQGYWGQRLNPCYGVRRKVLPVENGSRPGGGRERLGFGPGRGMCGQGDRRAAIQRQFERRALWRRTVAQIDNDDAGAKLKRQGKAGAGHAELQSTAVRVGPNRGQPGLVDLVEHMRQVVLRRPVGQAQFIAIGGAAHQPIDRRVVLQNQPGKPRMIAGRDGHRPGGKADGSGEHQNQGDQPFDHATFSCFSPRSTSSTSAKLGRTACGVFCRPTSMQMFAGWRCRLAISTSRIN